LKRPFGGPEYVLQYLGRYTHRVAHLQPTIREAGKIISIE
jgi:hypothetical protein